MSENLNRGFDIPLGELENLLSMEINGNLEGYNRIIPLRDMAQVNSISCFKDEVFYSLIRNIPIKGTNTMPYANSNIRVFDRGFEGLEVGQTFLLESKILSIMKNLSGKGLLGNFMIGGISNMLPLQIYGRDSDEKKAIAFYIPPIVEKHDDEAILLDGMHRTHICGTAGSAIKAVHISKVGVELPFKPISWKDTNVVNTKPDIDKRYINLRTEFYRDLSAV